MRLRDRLPNYLRTEDITDYEGYADYVIFKEGADTKAMNGNTGIIESTNTNSRTVIQYAINALLATGGKIFIRRGAYSIATALTINQSDLEIIMQKGAIITTTAAVNAIEIGATLNANNCIISGGELAGATTGLTGIYIVSMTRSTIRNMEISNFTEWGIDSQYNHSIFITECFVHNNGTSATAPYSGGIVVGHHNGGDTNCNAVRISRCTIETNITGVWIVHAQGTTVTDCVIENQVKHGLAIDRQGAGGAAVSTYIRSHFEANNSSSTATTYDIFISGTA